MSGALAAAALLLAQATASAPGPLPTPATQAAWELVFEAQAGRLFIDPASLRRDGARVRVHLRVDFSAQSRGGAGQMFVRQVMDCPARRHGYESAATYGPDGSPRGAMDFAPGEIRMEPIAAGSAEEALHRRLCPPRGA